MISQIILGVIVVIVLYLVWKWFFSSKDSKSLVGLHNAKSERRVSSERLGTHTQSYSYSIWVAVEDWNYRFDQKKIIFSRREGGSVGPEVYLGAQNNSLGVDMSTYEGGQEGLAETCTIHNVPLQKWVNIIIVLNNKAMDVYLDGKLVKTCILEGVPRISHSAAVYVCPDGGFAGSISNFRYYNYPLNPRQAYEIYREGYSGSSSFFDKYRIKLAFMKNNREVGSLEI